jgi:hypothetical protein
MNKGAYGSPAPIPESVPAGHIKVIATGEISPGAVVALLSDGTVQAIQSTVDSIGTEVVFDAGAATWTGTGYDPTTGKVVIAYADGNNSDYGTAVVGQIVGSTLTFGAAAIFNSSTTSYCRVVFQASTGRCVVAYSDGTNGKGRVGVISGTTISFGSSATFDTTASNLGLCYDSLSDQVVVSYKDGSSADRGASCVGTLSGTDTLTWGTTQAFEAGGIGQTDITYDANNQTVVAFYSLAGDSDGYAAVGTVSGATINYGSAVKFQVGTVSELRCCYDSLNKKVFCVYRNTSGSPTGLVGVVGTASGNTISFGTAIAIDTASTAPEPETVFDAGAGKVVVLWREDTTTYANMCTGTVFGNSITFDTASTVNSAAINSSSLSMAYSSGAGKVVFAYGDGATTNSGTANVWSSAGSTAGSWIGAAAETGTNAAPLLVTVGGGVNTEQTGLVANTVYYVANTGALTVTNTGRKFGRALSSGSILITGAM